ncbi:hypothetical protein F2Q69_00005820 [Brassica cretica]|uniref:Uncharacterized protein n=1 Tax=Brassica cretica TaxID=69181 RepID=A0A8S9PBF6_BRACR|nr:hypothetical protein F2Q69_00005820 [Brassica cretica]
MSEFLPAVFRPRRRLLRVISACSSASSSCSTYKISSSIMGLLNGESSRAVWLVALLGCTSASSFVSSERPVEWSCEVKSSSVNSCGSARIGCPENIFLNSSSIAALANALAAGTSAVRVACLSLLPPLRGVCKLFKLSAVMSD